jgi:hypothetical protein
VVIVWCDGGGAHLLAGGRPVLRLGLGPAKAPRSQSVYIKVPHARSVLSGGGGGSGGGARWCWVESWDVAFRWRDSQQKPLARMDGMGGGWSLCISVYVEGLICLSVSASGVVQ